MRSPSIAIPCLICRRAVGILRRHEVNGSRSFWILVRHRAGYSRVAKPLSVRQARPDGEAAFLRGAVKEAVKNCKKGSMARYRSTISSKNLGEDARSGGHST